MWTRYDLKMNAKMAFKRNYWTCVAASLVVGVLSGSMFAGSGSGVQTTLEYSIIIHMRMTVTAHILITAAIRYSGELFFLR